MKREILYIFVMTILCIWCELYASGPTYKCLFWEPISDEIMISKDSTRIVFIENIKVAPKITEERNQTGTIYVAYFTIFPVVKEQGDTKSVFLPIKKPLIVVSDGFVNNFRISGNDSIATMTPESAFRFDIEFADNVPKEFNILICMETEIPNKNDQIRLLYTMSSHGLSAFFPDYAGYLKIMSEQPQLFLLHDNLGKTCIKESGWFKISPDKSYSLQFGSQVDKK